MAKTATEQMVHVNTKPVPISALTGRFQGLSEEHAADLITSLSRTIVGDGDVQQEMLRTLGMLAVALNEMRDHTPTDNASAERLAELEVEVTGLRRDAEAALQLATSAELARDAMKDQRDEVRTALRAAEKALAEEKQRMAPLVAALKGLTT